jgi:DNA-binding transcriptional regulator YdaS (Cro superfamily)
MNESIKRAIEITGGQSALARRLSTPERRISQAYVWAWLHNRRRVPAEFCPEIEKVTGGQVKCEELRPDIDWAFLRKSAVGA